MWMDHVNPLKLWYSQAKKPQRTRVHIVYDVLQIVRVITICTPHYHIYIYIFLLLWRVCNAARLAPISFWRMGHGRVNSTVAIAVDGEKVPQKFWEPRFKTGIYLMKQFMTVSLILGLVVWNWHSSLETIHSKLILMLPLQHGDKAIINHVYIYMLLKMDIFVILQP